MRINVLIFIYLCHIINDMVKKMLFLLLFKRCKERA